MSGLTIPPGPITPSYGASKHAVIALTDTLRLHLVDRGADIGVTALCPGGVATNIVRNSPDMMRTAPRAMQPAAAAAVVFDKPSPTAGREQRAPREVAEAAEAAIRDGRPCSFTHETAGDRLRERFASILDSLG